MDLITTTDDTALAAAPTGTWKIDPMHTMVTFSVRHLMSKVRGRFSELAGAIDLGQTLAESSVTVSIDVASVDTGVQMRDDDLRSDHFFDVERFPTMTFTSTRIGGDEDGIVVTGDLTICDVTRRVELAVQYLGMDPTGLQGEPRLGFSGRTTVRRSDFAVGAAGAEGPKLVVGDQVSIELDIQAALEQ